MTVGSLFSGIGGFDLGFERAGFEIRWQVENEPFCQRVLEKHWPNVVRYGDITQLDGRELEWVDVICGGFPCQPVSEAGEQLAQADERWLWPEFDRIVRALRPRYVVVENVPGLAVANHGRAFGDVLGDLAASGYDVEWDCLPALAVGAPHRRDRVFFVAHARCAEWGPNSQGHQFDWSDAEGQAAGRSGDASQDGRQGSMAHTNARRWRTGELDVSGRAQPDASRGGALGDAHRSIVEGQREDWEQILSPRYAEWQPQGSGNGTWGNWTVEPDVGRVAHGVPARVDRLRGLGNAVVPQIAQFIAERIAESAGA